MDLKSIRNVHLYLGCFFAPLLMAFVLSGVLQTFHLHEERKDGYQPLAPVKALAEVHMHQRFSVYDQEPSTSFRFLVLLMSLGLLTTTGLGVFMAFRFTQPWKVMVTLFLGVVVPAALLWMAHH